MEFERRVSGIELRAEGRRLSGVVMKYGDVSPSHRERFEPGALRLAASIHLDLHHDPERAIAWHPGGGLALANGRDVLTMRAVLPPIPAADRALAEIKAGRVDGLSVEFRAVRERQDGDIRVIEDAVLSGIAIVKAPQLWRFPSRGAAPVGPDHARDDPRRPECRVPVLRCRVQIRQDGKGGA